MPRGNRSSRSVGLVTDGHEGFGRDPGLEDGAPAVEDGRSMARSVARPAGRRVAHAGDEALDGIGVALRFDGDEVGRVVQQGRGDASCLVAEWYFAFRRVLQVSVREH